MSLETSDGVVKMTSMERFSASTHLARDSTVITVTPSESLKCSLGLSDTTVTRFFSSLGYGS